jgi:hypothetical protein
VLLQTLDIRGSRDIALNRHGVATGVGNLIHDLVCGVATTSEVHHDGRTRSRQLPHDLRADAPWTRR